MFDLSDPSLSPPGFYSGTSNLVLPVKNKSMFPKEFRGTSRLTYYASLFNSVEINSSFYRLPMARTVAKWASEVPDDFRFTFKLWKEITHNKDLIFNPEYISRFFQTIEPAGAKKGCVLVQFPPRLVNHPNRLENLVIQLRDADPENTWRIAVEFRSKSWYNDETHGLLEEYKMGLVIHDLPASASPLTQTYAPFVYLRFHGPEGGYRGSYDDDILAEYASYINEWLSDGKTVFVYFNNTMGAAVHNLLTLNALVDGS